MSTWGESPAGKQLTARMPYLSWAAAMWRSASMPWLGSTCVQATKRFGCSARARRLVSEPIPIMARSMPHLSISASVTSSGSAPLPKS